MTCKQNPALFPALHLQQVVYDSLVLAAVDVAGRVEILLMPIASSIIFVDCCHEREQEADIFRCEIRIKVLESLCSFAVVHAGERAHVIEFESAPIKVNQDIIGF